MAELHENELSGKSHKDAVDNSKWLVQALGFPGCGTVVLQHISMLRSVITGRKNLPSAKTIREFSNRCTSVEAAFAEAVSSNWVKNCHVRKFNTLEELKYLIGEVRSAVVSLTDPGDQGTSVVYLAYGYDSTSVLLQDASKTPDKSLTTVAAGEFIQRFKYGMCFDINDR